MGRSKEERVASLVSHYEKRGQRSWVDPLLDLDREFPEVELFGEDCISAEVGPGWVPLLRAPIQALSKFGGKIGQIKQKFGGLRLYWDPPKALEEMQRTWWERGSHLPEEKSPYELSAEYQTVRDLVTKAENDSWKTCESCGSTDIQDPGPSYMTRCQRCRVNESL